MDQTQAAPEVTPRVIDLTAPGAAALLADHLRSGREEFERDATERRRKAEADFDAQLARYIDNAGRQFQHGGINSLLRTIAQIVEDRSQVEGDDFEKAAELIDACAEACDLKYAEPEPYSRADLAPCRCPDGVCYC